MKEVRKPQEREPITSESHKFSVVKPAGNDTALFEGLTTDPAQKKRLNDLVMGIYPNVEQVGFVNLDPQNAELQMAGGEFCGNATRSTAWQVLKGEPGDITIKVSGVENKLRAGVTLEGEAYAEMPVYADPSKIRKDIDNPGNYFVEMEGITHYVDFNPTKIKGFTEAELEEEARSSLKEKNLMEGPAAGIIYTERHPEGLKVTPVVYVRDIDTLFVETACGSGTAAVGLALAKETGNGVNELPIIQPTGMPIKVSVEYDGEQVGYTQIQGPVENLHDGSLEVKGNNVFAVEQIDAASKVEEALTKGKLNDLYRECFGGPPYYEKFSEDELKDIFGEYADDGKLFVARDKDAIIGFGASLPVSSVPEIGEIVAEKYPLDWEKTWYMADLGVKPEYRHKGIARKMVDERIAAAPDDATLLMRTSVNNIASQTLYRSNGFQDVPGAYQYVEQARTDGSTVADQRLFLVKKKV